MVPSMISDNKKRVLNANMLFWEEKHFSLFVHCDEANLKKKTLRTGLTGCSHFQASLELFYHHKSLSIGDTLEIMVSALCHLYWQFSI
jgi:hypothetical protein